jgi:hypothetical protein
MDYGKVLGRAWEITWRWKVLWVFGFLASLGQGTQSTSSYRPSDQEFNKWFQNPAEVLAPIIGVVVAIICILFIIFIILWVVSVISRGALIAGVVQVEDEGSTSFGRAWAAGRKKFWTLFGLGVLAAIPMIILVILGVIFFAAGVASGIGLMDVQETAGITTILTTSIICLCFLCCGMVLLGMVLEQIRVYGERAAILEDLGWIEAFKRGWQVIKENLGPTIILWLIFFAIGIVIFMTILIIIGVLTLPFLAVLGILGFSDVGAWMIVPAICGGLVMLVVFALLRSIVTTYISTTWTLAYRELTGWETALELEEVAS